MVCNYNGAAYIEDCLNSILVQQGVGEILVVDDASSDGSPELIRRAFPMVRLIELSRNGGPCVARNLGLRAARHAHVLAVDNDTLLAPDVLQKLRAALQADPGASIAQVRSVLYDEPERVHYDGADFHYVGLLSLRNFYRPLAEAEGSGVIEAQALIGICSLMDRDRVLAAGGYDEDFFYLAEDFELSYRLRLQGLRLLSVEDAIVLHRGGTQGLSFRGGGYPERRAYLHSINRWRILAKNYGLRTLLASAPGLLLYEAVWLLFVIKKGHLLQHLRGKRDFFRAWPQLMRSRSAIQAKRRLPDRQLLVGGPLTFSPSLVDSGAARACARLLDLCLRAWWRLARPFCT